MGKKSERAKREIERDTERERDREGGFAPLPVEVSMDEGSWIVSQVLCVDKDIDRVGRLFLHFLFPPVYLWGSCSCWGAVSGCF